MAALATAIAAVYATLSLARWPTLSWFWIAPSVFLAATAFLIARRGYLLRVGREAEWTLIDKVVWITHQLSAVVVLGLLLARLP